jgi:UDP-glucose 4-epimerase
VILLHRTLAGRRQRVALFGLGLIGSGVLRALRADGAAVAARHAIPWDAPPERRRALEGAAATISDALRSGDVLQVVWAAGRCGFGAGETEARAEREGFDEAVAILEEVARRTPEVATRLLLFSSAGGLFEGQRHVDRRSVPAPRRPYGRLKIHQERRVVGPDAPWRALVLRLSSVLGPPAPGQRRGLVATLLINGLRQRPSRIEGRMETLRDFVPVEDVAAFALDRMRRPDTQRHGEVLTLASAKPSSLAEVQHAVERCLGRKIYAGYALDPSNDMDITFSPSLRPGGFAPSDLRASVRRIHQALLAGGAVG